MRTDQYLITSCTSVHTSHGAHRAHALSILTIVSFATIARVVPDHTARSALGSVAGERQRVPVDALCHARSFHLQRSRD